VPLIRGFPNVCHLACHRFQKVPFRQCLSDSVRVPQRPLFLNGIMKNIQNNSREFRGCFCFWIATGLPPTSTMSDGNASAGQNGN
jgi:hypothetical protein